MKGINKVNDQDMEKVVGGISQDEALEAALKHAGLTRDQLDFVKRIEPDWEHERQIYEISFYQGGFEFEYNIDAETGSWVDLEEPGLARPIPVGLGWVRSLWHFFRGRSFGRRG